MVTSGTRSLVRLFWKRWIIERVFGRAKEWLLLDGLRVRGLGQATIHVTLSLLAMLVVGVSAVRLQRPDRVWGIKHFTESLL